MMSEHTQNEIILDEIFLKPSNEVKADRYQVDSENASCSGVCHTGACRGLA